MDDALVALRKGDHAPLTEFVINYKDVKLDFFCKNVDALGAQAVAKGLEVNRTIRELLISNNNIGKVGAAAIGKALEENKESKLEVLDINNDYLFAEGVKHIAAALKVNQTILHVNLDENHIGNEGAAALAAALEVNQTIRYLIISNNNIGYEGAAAIGKALQANLTLLYLGVGIELAECQVRINQAFMVELSNKCTDANVPWKRMKPCLRDVALAIKASTDTTLLTTFGTTLLKDQMDESFTPQKLLENVAREGFLEACKILIERTEESGINLEQAREAGIGSKDPSTRAYFRKVGIELLLNRYLPTPRDPTYESVTCKVYMAEDLEAKEGDVSMVALKFIIGDSAKENFDREMKSRKSLLNVSSVIELLRCHADSFCLVMPAAEYSLADFIRRRQLSGRNLEEVQKIMVGIARALQPLHQHHLVHGDIKPNNAVFYQGRLVLIDFDASAQVGQAVGLKYSTAYCPPELATVVAKSSQAEQLRESDLPLANPKFDLFSLGVLLFEMCTGEHIFPHVTDNITDLADLSKACVWLCIEESRLKMFPLASSRDRTDDRFLQKCNDARHLIKWCLQLDPEERPSIDEVLAHRFLDLKSTAVTTITTTSTAAAVLQKEIRMRYHIFVSHMQAEAAGDTGTLTLELRRYGAIVWRDMDAKNLTEEGMKQGVEDSDVFILFLSNAVLSRPYCPKEASWAIQAKKPFIVVVEQDPRHFSFDWGRWQEDKLTKLPGNDQWGLSTSLGCSYLQCKSNFPAVHDEIQSQWENKTMITFRRRDFELDAMIREIFSRAGKKLVWGERLAPKSMEHTLRSVQENVNVFIIHSDNNVATQITEELMLAFEKKYGISVTASDAKQREQLLDGNSVVEGLAKAKQVIVVLTSGVLNSNSKSMDHLRYAIKEGIPLFPIFSVDGGWEFGGKESKQASRWVMEVVGSLEAMEYRSRQKQNQEFEFWAMVEELISRMLRPAHPREKLSDEFVKRLD
eukprot:gb/GEZN01000915.1/.p1 GENE.gb/GEZN01000915.1/~~gb/GEZN01000915.1/.p1  ORF type:complete len:977 (+),score=142.12 gb/GEZN01000915.1/:59-2989(+)